MYLPVLNNKLSRLERDGLFLAARRPMKLGQLVLIRRIRKASCVTYPVITGNRCSKCKLPFPDDLSSTKSKMEHR